MRTYGPRSQKHLDPHKNLKSLTLRSMPAKFMAARTHMRQNLREQQPQNVPIVLTTDRTIELGVAPETESGHTVTSDTKLTKHTLINFNTEPGAGRDRQLTVRQ